MLENNSYFTEMKRVKSEYQKRAEEHKSKKQGIIDIYGCESDELKTWYKEKEKTISPYSRGTNKAYHAWIDSVRHQEEELEMANALWKDEVYDFIETLRKAGIKTFVYTSRSTATLENICDFYTEGCIIEQPCIVIRNVELWNKEYNKEDVKGIRFIINKED